MPKVRRHNHIYDVLTAAIDALSQYPEHNELVEQLTYERELLKPPKWTETAIEEAVENFIRINGRVPTTEDLKHDRNLPTHPSIELRYGVTAAEWLDQRYPYRKATPEDKKNLYTEENPVARKIFNNAEIKKLHIVGHRLRRITISNHGRNL